MLDHPKARFALALSLSIAALCLAGAQERAIVDQVKGAALTAPVPVDPLVTAGQFPNGLRYYIRVNKQPANRAELRLAVRAGSILEEDDQLGLAHFVEHMAFNGTTHFPKDGIPKFFESIGMRFGPSLNAFTSFDETVYMIQVPTDKPEVLGKAFLVLEDWAHNLSFDPAEIDKERGVIVEEWRSGRGAGARMRDKQLPVLLKGSRYAERLPIGTTGILQTFKHERLKKFYTDWYRPELMAVVAVGDFDKAAVEALLKTHFGSLPKTTVPRLRPAYRIPEHPTTLFAVATDKEQTTTAVGVLSKFPEHERKTVGAFRQTLVERLYTGMFNRRMAELGQRPDPPFLFAGGGLGAYGIGRIDVASLSVSVKEDGIERGLDAVLTESDRVQRFGFTATELDRQKREMVRSYERQFAEGEKQESSMLADELVRHVTSDEVVPGVAYEYALCQRFVPEITLAEINALSSRFSGSANRVVLLSAPEKPGLTVPDDTKLAAVLSGAAGKATTPWVDAAANAALMDAPPRPGAVTSETARAAIGVTEWTLSNGVKVVLKPTTNKADEVLFRATSPGGTSLASDADYATASAAAQIIGSGGLASFNAIGLRNLLAGKVASVRPLVSELEEGLTGSASPKDLETMFQLIYLTFTAPRADPTMFGVLSAQMKAMLANQKANPMFAFSEALQNAMSQGHLRGRPMTAETIDQWNLEKSMAFYKDRFGNAGDFTFVFVGSFTADSIKPLVERYLASLPATGRKETWKDVGMKPPTGVVERIVKKGIEPKSQTAIIFTGPFQFDQQHRIAIRAMVTTLQTKLRETLREDLSGTYGVGVSAGYSKYPEPRHTVSISFGCNPDRADELTKAVFKEIALLQANGPTEQQVTEVREAFLREYETNMKQNGYLVAQMHLKYQSDDNLDDLFALPEHYKRITPGMIQDAARTYLNTANYVKVALLPEVPAPAAAAR